MNIAGCPPIGDVVTATIVHFLTFNRLPDLDAEGRPLFAYGARIHDQCPRRANFDAGQFVEEFDDEAARKGWCLYKVGCKGPATFSPCPIFQWNTRTSWPIGAGHPCIGCTEPNFWDTMSPFYDRLPDVGGFGVESRVDLLGAALALGAAAGSRPTPSPPASTRCASGAARGSCPWSAAPASRRRAGGPPAGRELTMARTRVVVDPITRIEGHLRIEAAGGERADHQRVGHLDPVPRHRDHHAGPRSSRRLGLHPADLRRLHRGPRRGLVPCGRGRARHHHPAQREPDPQPDPRHAVRAGPRHPLLSPARARLGGRGERAQGRSRPAPPRSPGRSRPGPTTRRPTSARSRTGSRSSSPAASSGSSPTATGATRRTSFRRR